MKRIWNAEEKLQIEHGLQQKGYRYIVGVDEVGRGPLAGPVVCAAVVMPKQSAKRLRKRYEKRQSPIPWSR